MMFCNNNGYSGSTKFSERLSLTMKVDDVLGYRQSSMVVTVVEYRDLHSDCA